MATEISILLYFLNWKPINELFDSADPDEITFCGSTSGSALYAKIHLRDDNAHAWSMDVFFVFEFTEEENIYLQYDFGLGFDKTYEQNVS